MKQRKKEVVLQRELAQEAGTLPTAAPEETEDEDEEKEDEE